MAYALLGLEDVFRIKKELWEGTTQDTVALKYDMSGSYIGNISSGRAYDYVPWPDGSRGAMPKYRRDEIKILRKQMRKDRALEEGRILLERDKDRVVLDKDMVEKIAERLETTQLYGDKVPAQMLDGDGLIPDVRTLRVSLQGKEYEYVPMSELPPLDEDMQLWADAIAEDGWAAELAFGILLARNPVHMWTTNLQQYYPELLKSIRALLQKDARDARALVKKSKQG